MIGRDPRTLQHISKGTTSMRILWISAVVHAVDAAVVTYNWDITWVTASPDDFTRPVIGKSATLLINSPCSKP
jgi:hypothetical protein